MVCILGPRRCGVRESKRSTRHTRTRPRAKGLSGLIGGLEVLGEIVLSCPEEKGRLDAGLIDYFALEDALASVRTPFFVE